MTLQTEETSIPDLPKTLRGNTRHFAAIDELGLFKPAEETSVPRDACGHPYYNLETNGVEVAAVPYTSPPYGKHELDVIMLDPILKIVELQYELSFKLAGPTWLTDTDRVDTDSAMRIEAGELMESAGYKSWWSKEGGKIDEANCLVEIVDILHFMMQGLMQAQWKKIQTNPPQDALDEAQVTNLLHRPVAQAMVEGISPYYSTRPSVNDTKHWSRVRTANKWLGKMLLDGPRAAMPYFWVMCEKYSITPQLLISMYSAKNALNQFRKAYNYKGDIEGMEPYRKIWTDGQEDNVHVMGRARELADSGTTLSVSMVYEITKTLYFTKSGADPIRG